MVRLAHHIILAVLLVCLSAVAKDPAAYQVGDVADTDITTPVALDVIDAQATAALKSSEALKTPAIFETYPDATNEITRTFLAAFSNTRIDFVEDIQSTFQQSILTNGTIGSPDFGYFVTAFDAKHKNFPLTISLAAAWARGGNGDIEEGQYLETLLQTMTQPVRPDGELTFVLGDTVQLVPVNAPGQRPSLNDSSRGWLITSSGILTLSQARAQLESGFSQQDQPFARALADMLKPDCAPDKDLTQLARDRAIAGLVVDNHFDAGQLIVRRGETIDAKTKTALDELNEKLMPGVLTRQIAAERAEEQHQEEQAQHAQEQAELAQQQQQEAQKERDLAQTDAQRERAQAAAMWEQALNAQSQERQIRIRNEWLAATCAVISAVALLILGLSLRQRRAAVALTTLSATAAATVPAILPRAAGNQAVVSAEFAPHLAQAVKEALVQELAAQRREMLSVQQAATSDIAELVRRLDQLQIPLQERLHTYETQIQQLEKNLAARTEENRELLKMKIEMMRKQLETERRHVDFN
jgi:7TM-HD extracellular